MIDDVQLNFSPESLIVLNAILALMMFGVSLNLSPNDFKRIAKSPQAPAIGLVAQFVLLPFLTCLLTLLLKPHPSLALGMILVSSCPGGSFSNIITFIARGNLAVAVSMTAVSSLLAVVVTPLNFVFYAWMNPATRDVMTQVKLDPRSMVALVFTVVGLPLLLGMFCGQRFPTLKAKSETAMRAISLVVFFGFVGLAFSKNWALFITHAGGLALLVVARNLMGLGFCLATLFRQPEADRRAITLEIGIQNSGLGLTLLFTFMSGLGGAILSAAFWGIWHLVSGLLIAVFWGRRPVIATEAITDVG